jgi:3-oxoacyl-[acyl-carrier-protein] synthase II
VTSKRDHRNRPTVVVTGMGIVTSLGRGKADNWMKLAAGQSGVRRIDRFETDGLRTTVAGTIDFISEDQSSSAVLSERFADCAVMEAIAEAGIGARGDFPGPLFLAIAPVEIEWPDRILLADACGEISPLSYDDLIAIAATRKFEGLYQRSRTGWAADGLADRFGTKGVPISLNTACASGATAIVLGVEAIRRGEADAALCVGTDSSVNPETLVRFLLLSALSTRNEPPEHASRPFSRDRDGFVMGEGAGALVLESLDAATARGARILGVVTGCGESVDSFHRTRSSPDAKSITDCMKHALLDAGLSPDAIGYINAHGTGTPENDRVEYLGAAALFGKRIEVLPVSSNKSMIGHTLSAAGAIEAVFTFLTLERQRIPPTINYHVPDPMIPLDVVPNSARDVRMAHAMSNSFGFGGHNLSLIMSREPR